MLRTRRRQPRAALFKYRAYASWGQGETPRGDFADTRRLRQGRFLIGEAEQVKDEIFHYAEIARTDHILLRVQWPGWHTGRRSGTSSGSAGSSRR